MRVLSLLLQRSLLPRSTNLLSFALWVSVVGVALGVVLLMVVLGVMSGMQDFLRTSYTRITSEIVVRPFDGGKEDGVVQKAIEASPGVEATSGFLLGQAMLLGKGVAGVVLEGIDPESSAKVTDWKPIWVQEPKDFVSSLSNSGVWLGVQLAKKLGVEVGDKVRVFLPSAQSKVRELTVTGITKFGIYDHDLRYARVSTPVLRELMPAEPLLNMFKVKLKPGVSLEKSADLIQQAVGDRADVRLWSDVNHNLFVAVQHQKGMLFLVLEIIVGLSALNVANLLLMSAEAKRRDAAILRAMGLRKRTLFSYFLGQGMAVAVVGLMLGYFMGLAACRLVERFQPKLLSESVYNVTRLPISIHASDLVWIGAGGLVLCFVFSILPAWNAARLSPVQALRNE